ncbi:hypothetical protein [Flavobacterium rhizosphaerae]|uniref:Lipocalin-like domain-containing protein n=1 Tax=Flavobacterium rhizosphaerae TaxID=3163298 RepID=A0ABW8YWC4_9FLAO
MRKIFFLFLLAMFSACGHTYTDEELQGINGYWEIEKVVMPDGTEKDYKINSTIDFFEIKGNSGYRKKVMPQVDGTYIVNSLSEKLELIKTDEGEVILHYTTDYADWKEQLVKLDQDKLVIKNQHDITYYYKKPQPFTVK